MNPSGLAIKVKRYVLGSLIPNAKFNGAKIQRSGMHDLHTEVRLLNYMAGQNIPKTSKTISVFSSRSVCTTNAKAIGQVQLMFANTVGFMSYELPAQDRSSSLSEVYAFLAREGSLGTQRDTSTAQASFPMNV